MDVVEFDRRVLTFWLALTVAFFIVFFVSTDQTLFVIPSTILTVGTTYSTAYFANQDGISGRGELFWWLSSVERPSLKTLALATLIAILGVLQALGISVIRALVESTPQDVQHSVTTGSPDTQTIILIFMTVVVVIPLVEEWFVRGILQRFLTRVSHASVAILLTSTVFALYHIPNYGGLSAGVFWPILVVFCHSILWGWLYYRTGNVLVTWVAHGLTNFAALANWLWV